jgi:hypothetical protein
MVCKKMQHARISSGRDCGHCPFCLSWLVVILVRAVMVIIVFVA